MTAVGRRFTDDEIERIVAAWAAEGAATLETLGAAAGITLTPPKLAALNLGRIARATIIAAIGDALAAPHGLALREVRDAMHASLALVAVDPTRTRLFVATGRSQSRHDRPSKFWPQLGTWHEDLARNRARVDAWFADPKRDVRHLTDPRVSFDLVPPTSPTPIAPTMADQIARLRAAIVADPEDVAPRLVLADLLQQQGDPHGELIAIQCTLATNPPADVFKELVARAQPLVETHGARIASDVATHASAYRLGRGFVEWVAMTAGGFARHGAALLAEHPIRALQVDPIAGDAIAELARTPALARIRNLWLQGSYARDPIVLAPLGSSPHLATLAFLRLNSLATTPADWCAAFARLRAPRLDQVSIYTGNLDLAALADLIANPSLPALARLAITDRTGSRTDDASGFQSLTAAPAVFEALAERTTLRDVELASCRFVTAVALATWFAGPGGRALERLQITGGAVDDRALAVLARAPNLRELHLTNPRISAQGLFDLLTTTDSLAIVRVEHRELAIADDFGARLAAALPAAHPLRDLRVLRSDGWLPMPPRFSP